MDNPFATSDVARSIYGDATRSYLNPSALFVDSNYRLRFNAWSSAAGVTLALRYRFLRATDSEIVDSAEQLAPTSNRVLTTVDIALPIGFLINIDVFALAGAPAFGTTFMQVQLIRGAGAAATVVSTLLQAYIAANVAKAWPGSPLENSLDGPGVIRSITGTVPAAGAEVSEAVPAGARWSLLAFRAQLVTAIAAANRSPQLSIDDGANIFCVSETIFQQAASLTLRYNWFGGATLTGTIQGIDVPIPLVLNNYLAAAFRVRTLTQNIQAADQWNAVQYLVREWLTAD